MNSPRYTIGKRFTKVGGKNGNKSVWAVTDILTTHNFQGHQVKIRYVATHIFCGHVVTDADVLETTIARGEI